MTPVGGPLRRWTFLSLIPFSPSSSAIQNAQALEKRLA
jgi:hypothetical protein